MIIKNANFAIKHKENIYNLDMYNFTDLHGNNCEMCTYATDTVCSIV